LSGARDDSGPPNRPGHDVGAVLVVGLDRQPFGAGAPRLPARLALMGQGRAQPFDFLFRPGRGVEQFDPAASRAVPMGLGVAHGRQFAQVAGEGAPLKTECLGDLRQRPGARLVPIQEAGAGASFAPQGNEGVNRPAAQVPADRLEGDGFFDLAETNAPPSHDPRR
jgi:hypothetical protein